MKVHPIPQDPNSYNQKQLPQTTTPTTWANTNM